MSLWDADFKQTFHFAKNLGPDFRGTESFGPVQSAPCRAEPSGRLVRTADGRQVVSECNLHTSAAVTVKDRVWLPGADPTKVGASRLPLRVAEQVDLETGQVDHYEVTL